MQDGFEDRFEHGFTATEHEARAALDAIMARLARLGLPDQRAGDVRIALTEAVNNIVEHAYAGRAPGRVSVAARTRRDRLELCLCDRGRALPGEALPHPGLADLSGPVQSLPEGGFGWFLIWQLADTLDYRREGGENRLTLGFALGSGG